MTKINHRHANALRPPRRTPAAFDSAPVRELAYLDATTHLRIEEQYERARLRYGRHVTLAQFVYQHEQPRRGGSR
jgi:hypothetical protein